jgi:hypothetical protein
MLTAQNYKDNLNFKARASYKLKSYLLKALRYGQNVNFLTCTQESLVKTAQQGETARAGQPYRTIGRGQSRQGIPG